LGGNSKVLVNHYLNNKNHDEFSDLNLLSGHFSLQDFCSFMQTSMTSKGINHVKFYCDKSNYLVVELLEDKEFNFEKGSDWFGFKKSKFKRKGKYYSVKPLDFYRTDLFLRSDLVDKKKVKYNGKPSDILYIIPVDDDGRIKLNRLEPGCTVPVNKTTNKATFSITDENGEVVNFQGSPVLISFNVSAQPYC
uniref:hypothetical protein n=1 Tax=Bartonella sp. CL41QHWL TaxID=3243527 RepID=UPI0035CF1AC1